MKTILASLILVMSAATAHALKPSYVVTTNNAERLGLTVTVKVDVGTSAVSRVTIGIQATQPLTRHKASLIIRSSATVLGRIPLAHLSLWREKHYVTRFDLRSSLIQDTSIVLDAVPGTGPRYEIKLKDWKEESEQSDGETTSKRARSAASEASHP